MTMKWVCDKICTVKFNEQVTDLINFSVLHVLCLSTICTSIVSLRSRPFGSLFDVPFNLRRLSFFRSFFGPQISLIDPSTVGHSSFSSTHSHVFTGFAVVISDNIFKHRFSRFSRCGCWDGIDYRLNFRLRFPKHERLLSRGELDFFRGLPVWHEFERRLWWDHLLSLRWSFSDWSRRNASWRFFNFLKRQF